MESKGHSIDECPLREKIEENADRSKDNQRKIEQLVKGDWYSNKDLYKMIQNLTSQLTEFNGKFDKYNGLIEDREKDRELLEKFISKVNKIETKGKTEKEITTNWRERIGWIIAILLALSKLGVF